MRNLCCRLAVASLLLSACVANAQVSGTPGDGIPDFYYFSQDGLFADTTFGQITRPAGTLTVDSDGFDINAMLVGGANVSLPPACDLCEGPPAGPGPNNLPESSATQAGTYTVGYGGVVPTGSSQWIRTSPLQGRGFVGVIGTGFVNSSGVQQPWPSDFPPFLAFPQLGLANYGPGLTDADFPQVFNDGATDATWSVRVASGATGAALFTNVTVLVPEPTSGLLSVLGLAALSFIRRR